MIYRCKYCRAFESAERAAVEMHADRCRESRKEARTSEKLARQARNIATAGQRVGGALMQVAAAVRQGEELLADVQHAIQDPGALLEALRKARGQ